MSAEGIDREAEAKRKGFRITLDTLKAGIEETIYFTADSVIAKRGVQMRVIEALKVMTICILVMRSGYVVIGKSASVDPKNFDAELGRKFAYDDAIRQLWPLYAFVYKEQGLP